MTAENLPRRSIPQPRIVPKLGLLLCLACLACLACLHHAQAQQPTSTDRTYPFWQTTQGNYYQLEEAREYCFDSLVRLGPLDRTSTIFYSFVPDVGHYGSYIDLFVGFRRKSEPGRLWLQNNNLQWVEYLSNEMPVANNYRPVILGTEASIAGYTFVIPQNHNFSDPPEIDLTGLAGDGELLVGYGRRLDAAAGVADSFQEMLDSRRFATVWEIGESDASAEICVLYDNIRIMPDDRIVAVNGGAQ